MLQGRVPSSIFPLPLVPFESMMMVDDRAGYPMTCGAEFTFLGAVDRAALTSAVRQATARHPLLTCRIKSQRGRLSWVPGDESVGITWLEADQTADYPAQPAIDLRRQAGLQISVACDGETTRLRFYFHHACCDAAGGLAFVEDLLVFYAAACRGSSSSLSPRRLQLGKLKQRGQLRGPPCIREGVQRTAAALRECMEFVTQRPAPLAAPATDSLGSSTTSDNHCYAVRHYSEEFLRGLRREATALGTTLNDLIAGNLFRTLRAWQIEQSSGAEQQQLRIVIPVNLRDPQDVDMPAANRMGYGFVSLPMELAAEQQRLLVAIRERTERLRRLRLPQVFFLRSLALIRELPGGLDWLMSTQRCLATAVLTNIGDPTRRFAVTFPRDRGRLVAGNLILERMSSVAPLRPFTRAVFSVNTYANRLTLTARCDPRYFSPDHAARLLRGLVPASGAHEEPLEDELQRRQLPVGLGLTR